MVVRQWLPLATLALIVGCSGERPPDEEILRQLAARVDVPGCARSTLFTRFPVTPDSNALAGNTPVFDALVDAGLLLKEGDAYALSALGQKAYVPARQGFCYTSGYAVRIKEVSAADPDDLGSSVEKGWTVAFEVVPRNVESWVKNERLLAAADARLAKITDAQDGLVQIVRIKGQEGYRLVAPRYSHDVDIHFNQAW